MHLRTAAAALAEAGHEVWVLFPEADRIKQEIVAQRSDLADRIKPYLLVPSGRLVRSRDPRVRIAGKWQSVRRAVEAVNTSAHVDLVFFMYLDEFMAPLLSRRWLDATFRFPWAGIYMQPLYRLQNASLGKRPEWLRRDHLLRSRRFRGAMVLDEASIPWLTERFGRRFVPMPEYGDMAEPDREAPEVKELLAFAKGRPIIGAFGSLSKRKGLLTLLRAAPRFANRDFVIAIAGSLASQTFAPEELVELEVATTGLGDRCWYRPNPIGSDAAFSALLSVSSVVYIAYEDWVFSSGLQSIAAQYHVPTVVANVGIMADRATKYGTGRIIDPTDADEAAAAVDVLLSNPPAVGAYEPYNKLHTIDAFRRTVCDLVAELAGGRGNS